MGFLIVGLLLLALKLGGVGFFAELSWLWVLLPFALATAWWSWSDDSGRTKRQEMEKYDAKRDARRQEHIEALGLGPRKPRK